MPRPYAAFLMTACLLLTAGKWDRLEDVEKDHYRALKTFMDDKEEKAWLKLKTQEERDASLKDQGLWDKFYAHDAGVREQILAGDVRLGWDREQVYMAWGPPFQKQRLTGRNAARSEKLVYRFEVDKDGFATPLVGKKLDYKAVARYQVELVVDDDYVAALVEKDDWE